MEIIQVSGLQEMSAYVRFRSALLRLVDMLDSSNLAQLEAKEGVKWADFDKKLTGVEGLRWEVKDARRGKRTSNQSAAQ